MENANHYAASKTQAAQNLDFAQIIAEMYGTQAATLTPQEVEQLQAEIEKDFYYNTQNR